MNFSVYVRSIILNKFSFEQILFCQLITTIVDCFFLQTNLLYKLKKTIYSRRKFRVTIYPGHDNILVMAMIMTFFVEK
jgi:hypothetical protein